MSYKIIKDYIKKNDCYKAGKKRTSTKGLMLHSTGCGQPDASVWKRVYNKSNYKVSVHGFISGKTGAVRKTLPWDYKAWHAGKSSTNAKYIGVEMCESGYIKYTHGDRFTITNKKKAQAQCKIAYDSAVKLFGYLCVKYDLDPLKDGVIISHHEGHVRGIASGHTDPEHYWKQLDMPYTMNGFRKDVAKNVAERKGETFAEANPESKLKAEVEPESEKEQLYRVRKSANDVKSQLGAFYNLDYAKAFCKEHPNYHIYDKNDKLIQ